MTERTLNWSVRHQHPHPCAYTSMWVHYNSHSGSQSLTSWQTVSNTHHWNQDKPSYHSRTATAGLYTKVWHRINDSFTLHWHLRLNYCFIYPGRSSELHLYHGDVNQACGIAPLKCKVCQVTFWSPPEMFGSASSQRTENLWLRGSWNSVFRKTEVEKTFLQLHKSRNRLGVDFGYFSF